MSDYHGLKTIIHTTQGVCDSDDDSYPYKLDAIFTANTNQGVTTVMAGRAGGRERLVVRSMTKEGLEGLIAINRMSNDPRLISLTLTGPGENVLLQLP